MIKRQLVLPGKSFLLFGPRGVGKSTLLKQQVNASLKIDLLKSSEFLFYRQNPDELIKSVKHLRTGSWVLIDEVQRVPEILNIVHLIYESQKLNFALSGSSARNLRRGGANLLAGRALQTVLFPFVHPEFKKLITIEEAVEWGTLPLVVTEKTYRLETLSTYVETYLREEIIQEGLIRKIDSFVRFLQVAGIMNAQTLNIDNIAREAQVARSTVQTYFDILVDTLIGFYLPAYQPGLKVKEVSKPKFYFFDSGVARACAGLHSYPLEAIHKGYLFETFMINQIKAYNEYSQKKLTLCYYGVSGGHEIDLIIEVRKRGISAKSEIISIEFKSSPKWKSDWNSPSKGLKANTKVKVLKQFGVYMGERRFVEDDINIIPADEFLKILFQGDIF